jgi:ferredoxin
MREVGIDIAGRGSQEPLVEIAAARARIHLYCPGGSEDLYAHGRMTYLIAGSCIKDDSCVEVCPVDCIHPKPGAPDFEEAEQLYIDPAVCIDCDACVEACPVDAIFPDFDVPAKFDYALDLNAEYFAERTTAERTAA